MGNLSKAIEQRNIANGYVGADGSGKVDPAQLPSYVDDVLEFDSEASLPVTGEAGKIYVTLDSNFYYRWTGTVYVDITGKVDSVAGKTGAVTLDKTDVGLDNVDNTSDATKDAAVTTLTNKTLTAPAITSPTGIVKADVGLSNVDNTSDAGKPVSTAQQSALDLKAPIANPTFTGTVGGVDKTMVGLSNVDNTADTAKPVSTAQQAALDLKTTIVDTNTRATSMSKAGFEAIARDNRDKFAGSGFVEFGKHESGNDIVNQGIISQSPPTSQSSDIVFYGRLDSLGIGTSKTGYPQVNMNGSALRIEGTEVSGYNVPASLSSFKLPPAPTVTHADSSNSGLILNGRDFIDTTSWASVNSTTLSVSNGSIEHTCTTTSDFGQSQSIATVVGKKYLIEYEVTSTLASHGILIGSIVDSRNVGGIGRYVHEFIATETSTPITLGRGDSEGSTGVVAVSFSNIAVFPAEEISRKDLVFLETWHEDTSEKGVLYDLGNTQFKGTISAGTAGAFSGSGTYSLFGNWQSADDLVGNSISIASLSDAELKDFVGNAENNCYYDGDKLIQIRYRVRVVQGLGDEWFSIDPQANTSLRAIQADPFLNVIPKGKNASVLNDLDNGLDAGNWFVEANNTASTLTTEETTGVFKARYGLATTAHGGECYALPIALVHRRNQGAFHPVFNSNGSAEFDKTTLDGFGYAWNHVYAHKPKNISECSIYKYASSGSIASGQQDGRPDGLFYDQIHEGDIQDLRKSSHKKDRKSMLFDAFNRAVSGVERGSEGEWEVVENTSVLAISNLQQATTMTYFRSSASVDIDTANGTEDAYSSSFLFLVQGNDGTWYKCRRAYSDSNYTHVNIHEMYGDVTTNFTNGNDYRIIVAKQSTRTKSNTLTHCDIIGDPANYYRGQDYTNTGASQTVAIGIGDVHWNSDGNDTGGLDGHFYESKIINAGVDISLVNYGDSNWTDLGTDWDGAGSWRKDGVSGTPLLVGENGEDYLDFSTYTLLNQLKASRKSSLHLLSLVSLDNGVTWTVQTNDIDSITNKFTQSVGLDSPRIFLSFYTTHTNIAESALNSEVLEIGDAIGWNGGHTLFDNSPLNESLVGKVPNYIGTTASLPISKNIEDVITRGSDRVIYSPSLPNHSAFSFATAYINGVKALPYLTRENGKAYMNLVFKEMKFDIDWGDDAKFNIVDNVTTTTDDNANTVLIGQKRIELPYFIGDV